MLGINYNKLSSKVIKPTTSFEYTRSYMNGLVRVNQPINLTSSCLKIVGVEDMALLNECLDRSAKVEEKLKMEIYKRHVE